MRAICSEVKLPSRDGGAEDDGTASADCSARYWKTAGDIGTFGGGVGGTGEASFLNAAMAFHCSFDWGMMRDGSELRCRGEAVDLRELVSRTIEERAWRALYESSSSEETSYKSSKSVA